MALIRMHKLQNLPPLGASVDPARCLKPETKKKTKTHETEENQLLGELS